MYNTMYQYYAEQQVLPTFGGFQSLDDLEHYEIHRRELFNDKLRFPPQLFEGRSLVEFGPDSGENSLVFAQWGAECTLVEPNLKSHSVIHDYFDRFELTHRLNALSDSDILSFGGQAEVEDGYDIIDVEGFVYTVEPRGAWMNCCANMLNENGFLILFDYELFGCFNELLFKAIHSVVKNTTGAPPLIAAENIFGTKWSSIPHKRSMESWVMDVLENPFVRMKNFYEPKQRCREFDELGLRLYSAWPPYRDGLHTCWYKKKISASEQISLQEDFLSRSVLSHVFGRPHFLLSPSPNLEHGLKLLIADIDAVAEGSSPDRLAASMGVLDDIAALLVSDKTVGRTSDRELSVSAVDSHRRILALLVEGDIETLESHCNQDDAFIETWGQPSHFSVFQRRRVD